MRHLIEPNSFSLAEQLAQPDMPVLHPLPRIDEIKLDVDNDPLTGRNVLQDQTAL